MRLGASVPAEQLSQVRVGMPVEFKVTGYPTRTFLGRITRVNPTADAATRQVKIIAAIPNSGNTLVGGVFLEGGGAPHPPPPPLVPLPPGGGRGPPPTNTTGTPTTGPPSPHHP